jgi:hypothetical protein
MKRALLAAALVALLAGSSAPAKPFHSLLGIVSVGGGNAQLVILDPETLNAQEGSSVLLGKQGGSWSFSPDRSQFVYADRERVRFFDLFRFIPESVLSLSGGGEVAWLDTQTVVMLRRAAMNAVEVVKIDAATHKVRSKQRVVGVVASARTATGVIVALLARNATIAKARLLVVEPRRTRVIPVTGVRTGAVWQGKNPPIGTLWTPGFALDEATWTAYLADPSGLVVALPIFDSTAMRHAVRGRLAKVVHSYERRALALGDGLLAITGEELSPDQMRPAGVELVDTRTWTSHLVELGARGAWAAGDGLVVTGTTMGLAALDRSGHARFRLFEGSGAWVQAVVGTRAFVGVGGESQAVIVDLASGQVVGKRPWPLPQVLQERSSSD